jgi:nitrogen fixation-related uncharacterized protein
MVKEAKIVEQRAICLAVFTAISLFFILIFLFWSNHGSQYCDSNQEKKYVFDKEEADASSQKDKF